MLSINSNAQALTLANYLGQLTQQLSDTSERLATGKRINSAADDPAGIAVASRLRSQDGSWGAVQKNLTFGTSLLETSASALGSVQTVLQNMRDLSVEAASETLSTTQRAAVQATFAEYQSQIDTITDAATLFGQNLISATAAAVNIQSGINAGDTLAVTTSASDATTLGVNASTLATSAGASAAITAIDAAIATVSGNQAKVGAQLNSMDVTIENVGNLRENLGKALSRVEDADIAQESSNLALLQTKQQMAIQMLGMVNQFPQFALGLLR